MEYMLSLLIKILEWLFFITASIVFLVCFIFFYGFAIHLRKKKKRNQNNIWKS
jgi:heme/copper-type cytochrome/quinol oxidase subunit 2